MIRVKSRFGLGRLFSLVLIRYLWDMAQFTLSKQQLEDDKLMLFLIDNLKDFKEVERESEGVVFSCDLGEYFDDVVMTYTQDEDGNIIQLQFEKVEDLVEKIVENYERT